jgi:hypothetical protein
MPWTTLNSDDLLRGLTGAERSALQTAALGSGQADPLPGIIADVVAEARGYIAANKANVLGEGNTVPEKLRAALIARVRFEAFTRLPVGRSLLTEDRVKANEAAVALLRDVAAGRYAIEEPAVASAEVISAPGPKFTKPVRQFTRENQDGL